MSPVTTSSMTVLPSTLSWEEFIANHSGENVELVDGQVIDLPMRSPNHGIICARTSRLLGEYAEKHACRNKMCRHSFVRTKSNPNTVRAADISYYSHERLLSREVPEGVFPFLPELIVEVCSKSDRWISVFAKVVEYLTAGVRVVVLLDEPSCSASVYRSDEIQQIFHNGDELTIPDVFPGFAVPVRRFFE